ncbi:MAG: pyruvate formate lyase family protein [Bifidobacterium breve]
MTLEHLGPGPEPNITIFWDPKLPEGYKRFCAKISIDTSAIQYESDKEIRSHWGDDAAIACCVSPMRVGKQMQFFAARVNSAKALLYAINGGRDEMTGMQVIDKGIIDPSPRKPMALWTTRRSRTTMRRLSSGCPRLTSRL